MEDLIKSFERRLDAFYPKQDDEVERRRLIREFTRVFSREDTLAILTGREPLFYEKGKPIYLP